MTFRLGGTIVGSITGMMSQVNADVSILNFVNEEISSGNFGVITRKRMTVTPLCENLFGFPLGPSKFAPKRRPCAKRPTGFPGSSGLPSSSAIRKLIARPNQPQGASPRFPAQYDSDPQTHCQAAQRKTTIMQNVVENIVYWIVAFCAISAVYLALGFWLLRRARNRRDGRSPKDSSL